MPQEVSKQVALLAAVSALASLHHLSIITATASAKEGAPVQPEATSAAASKAPVDQPTPLPTETGKEALQQTPAANANGEAPALQPIAAAAAEQGTPLPPTTTPAVQSQRHQELPSSAEQGEGAPPPPVAATAEGEEGAPLLAAAAASEALLRGACSVLSARGTLTLHHGAFVKACLGRLAGLLALLGTPVAGGIFRHIY